MKSGSDSSALKESMMKSVTQLTKDDLLVINSGTNDLVSFNFSKTFLNIKDYLMNTDHTSIILLSIPFRYDLPNHSFVNSEISKLNRKLLKLSKLLPHTMFVNTNNNRKLFSNHGLHCNKTGKRFVNSQVAYQILVTFHQNVSPPVPLGWYESLIGTALPTDRNQINPKLGAQTALRNQLLDLQIFYGKFSQCSYGFLS